MKGDKQIRTLWLHIRLNESEDEKLHKLYDSSTSNSLSEYARDVLLKQPVNISYRNESADKFLDEIILLRKELNALGNNFNQAVHKLHTLDQISEIKSWIMVNESCKNLFLKKAEEIKEKMNQIYEQWLQK